MIATQQEQIVASIKAHLDHISGEVKQGLFALKHGDESSLELSLVAIQRVCLTTLQQLREARRGTQPPLALRQTPAMRSRTDL